MRLIWPVLIVFQIWLASEISFKAFDAAHVSYRHQEFVAALKAQDDHPSSATKAAVQEELHLASHHVIRQQFAQFGLLLVVFLMLDVVCLYGWRNFKRNFGYKSPSA
jgi:hypothetical protein